MKFNPLKKSNELVRALRQNQTSSNPEKINQQRTEPVDQENSSKQIQKTRDWVPLILVCAIVVFMAMVMIERIFVKDDTLLNLISSMFTFILGYYFGYPKPK